jgi:hypothetical protein
MREIIQAIEDPDTFEVPYFIRHDVKFDNGRQYRCLQKLPGEPPFSPRTIEFYRDAARERIKFEASETGVKIDEAATAQLPLPQSVAHAVHV